jgi:site-specific recombinase XerD
MSLVRISSRFNRAFQRAGLPYTGTHILRHGGTRVVLNSTGDLSIAQQALGNRDMKSTLVYAQRDKQALNGLFKQRWREHENSLTSQSEVVGGREHNGTVN